MSRKPLLLSPAGSPAALSAAINAGADEVYIGGSAFNARINASNFDSSALIKAGELCRSSNVALHITLNTLIYNKELEQVLDYVSFLNENVHPNALIVQDLGVVKLLRQNFPDLPLHASTQMRIHSPLDAKYLKDLGFTRAVLARELPKEDIKAFADTGLETEIFVHGAICVSESGGCLMSSLIGGRSGNRGECAQPCRLHYKSANKYPLSLKDMCLASHIAEISDIGVTSLKIEGRMKSPEYVAGVTSIYRRLIDENRNATQAELNRLSDIFSRSGFTDGYFTGKINKAMFGVRTEEDKKRSNERFLATKAQIRPKASSASAPSSFILPERDLSKTLPLSKQKGLVLRFENTPPSDSFLKKYAPKAIRIDIPLSACSDKRFAKYSEKISALIPRSIFLSELDSVKTQISAAKKNGICNATISSLNHITLCDGMFLHGDYVFNVTNKETLSMLEGYSLSSVMLSPETNGKFIRKANCALEYILYGRTPLMYTRTCIISNIGGCKHSDKCFSQLTDRTGARFPVFSGPNHTNTIYNSVPSYRLDKKSELKKAGINLFTLFFTDEDEKQIENIISLYESEGKPNFEYTRR